MPSFQKLIVMGNLTRDTELRMTPNGTALCNFSVAVNRKFKVGIEQREEVLYLNCEAWSITAENIAKYFHKGDLIFLEGRLKENSWEDKVTKEKKSRMVMVVETFQFMQSRGARQAGSGPATPAASDKPATPGGNVYSTRPPPTAAKPAFHPDNDLDEDVPF